jgi:hypothetical protein
MSPVDKEREVIRLYFLGQLSEEERERLEMQFVTDADFQEGMLIVEEELIEDYLADSLSAEDKQSFDSHLRSTPQQRQRLEIAGALNRYCAKRPLPKVSADDSKLSDSDPVGLPNVGSKSFFQRSAVAYSLAAVLLVGAVVGAWSLFGRWRRPDFHRELVLLNGPQGRDAKADVVVKLFPDALRGDESLKSVPQRQSGFVEIQLALPPGEHSSYRVTLRGGSIPDGVSVSNLEPGVSAGRVVPVKIPTGHLAPGVYFLELAGVTPEGTFEGVTDYRFRVSD